MLECKCRHRLRCLAYYYKTEANAWHVSVHYIQRPKATPAFVPGCSSPFCIFCTSRPASGLRSRPFTLRSPVPAEKTPHTSEVQVACILTVLNASTRLYGVLITQHESPSDTHLDVGITRPCRHKPRTETPPADACATPVALRTFHKLVVVLCPLAAQGTPLASATAHVTCAKQTQPGWHPVGPKACTCTGVVALPIP
jgi:hypothetical protein